MPTSWAPLVCIVQQCSSALRESFFVLGQLVGCLRSHQLKGYHRDRINIKQLILSALQSLLLVFAAHCYKNSHFQCAPLPDGSSAQPVCGLLLPVHQPVAEKSKVRALSEVVFFFYTSLIPGALSLYSDPLVNQSTLTLTLVIWFWWHTVRIFKDCVGAHMGRVKTPLPPLSTTQIMYMETHLCDDKLRIWESHMSKQTNENIRRLG